MAVYRTVHYRQTYTVNADNEIEAKNKIKRRYRFDADNIERVEVKAVSHTVSSFSTSSFHKKFAAMHDNELHGSFDEDKWHCR